MKKLILMTAVLSLVLVSMGARSSRAMQGMAGMENMEEGSKNFSETQTVDGVKAVVQVMKLSDMNMSDPDGKTHHVMIDFFDAANGEKLKTVAGRVKLIAPSKKEQVADLKDYGGTYAANVSFDEPGKWGVICLFAIDGKKRVLKLWYPNHEQ